MTATFIKQYRDPRRAAAARAHHAWLATLDCGLPLPRLLSVTENSLEFEHLGHRHPGPNDLPALADALGKLHATGYSSQLHAAQLHQPFTTTDGLVIADFVTPRRTALEQMPIPTACLPVALYKDANIRNFILTDDGPAIVDFDDLTLAPFGYDLAKLIVSTAMTHGHLDPDAIEDALTTYNTHTAIAGSETACPLPRLRAYTEFHHLCTLRYLHRHGYRHAWSDVRPWPQPTRPAKDAGLCGARVTASDGEHPARPTTPWYPPPDTHAFRGSNPLSSDPRPAPIVIGTHGGAVIGNPPS